MLQNMINKLLGRPSIKVIRNDWLDSPEGIRFQEVGEYVYDKLDGWTGKWPDKKIQQGSTARSINETTKWLAEESEYDSSELIEHILLWLNEASIDEYETDEELHEHFRMMNEWVREELKERKISIRSMGF